MDSTLVSLAGFAVAMYITPGPNNVMLASSGASHGIRATIPHMLGIAAGFALMLVLVSGGLGSLLLAWPALLRAMRWIGAAWMLVLAWQIAIAPPPGRAERGRVLGFTGAAAFQWINPKAWVMIVSALTAYAAPQDYLRSVAIVTLVFGAVTLPCIAAWASFGAAMRRVLADPRFVRPFNVAMALLLVASIVPVFFEN